MVGDKVFSHIDNVVGAGFNRAFSQLIFTHVNTKSWSYSKLIGIFRRRRKIEKYTLPGQINFQKYNGELTF